LADCLAPLAGAQALIVAACHGCFLEIGEPGRRVVLTSCGADEKYWVHGDESLCSQFIVELFAAWCAFALWDHLPLAKLPLDGAFERAKERLAGAHARTVPLCAGSADWPTR
jgi:hypothetical protein